MNSPQHLPRRRFRLAAGGQPVLFAPRAVIILIAILALVHLLRAMLAPEIDSLLLVLLGVLPVRYLAASEGVRLVLPGGYMAAALPLLSYAFLHVNLLHLAVNSAWLLAFGTVVARLLGAWRFVLFYLVCGVTAALVHVLFNAGSQVPMVGASGAISGLMGAAFRVSLPQILGGKNQTPGRLTPLTDRRFLIVSAVWIISNIAFGLTGIRVADQVLMIAWDAHIGGFITGLLLIGPFCRRLRQAR